MSQASKIGPMEAQKKRGESDYYVLRALKVPYYLLILSGFTLSKDGVTISRFMIFYSGAIYLLNMVLLLMSTTCFGQSFQSQMWSGKLITILFQILIQVVATVMLVLSTKQTPNLVKKFDEIETLIDDEIQQKRVQMTLNRMVFVGSVAAVAFAAFISTSKFLMYPDGMWDICPNHRIAFSDRNLYENVVKIVNISSALVAFQTVACLTFCVSLCRGVALYFKHLNDLIGGGKHLEDDGQFDGTRGISMNIHRIRIVFEATCELTAKLDDVITVPVGMIVLIGM